MLYRRAPALVPFCVEAFVGSTGDWVGLDISIVGAGIRLGDEVFRCGHVGGWAENSGGKPPEFRLETRGQVPRVPYGSVVLRKPTFRMFVK